MKSSIFFIVFLVYHRLIQKANIYSKYLFDFLAKSIDTRIFVRYNRKQNKSSQQTFGQGGHKMNNRVSEIRIQNNKRRRRRQLRKNMTFLFLTMLISLGFSTLFFSMKARAQDYGKKTSEEQIFSLQTSLDQEEAGLKLNFHKYYKSLAISRGDTLWDLACRYADNSFYDTYESFIEEVIQINHLPDETIIAGQKLIIPYYDAAS